MHLKQFLKNDTILNGASLNSDQQMAIQRQQLLLIHNIAYGADERTQFDLLQNHLNYLHGQQAADYYEAHASKVKALYVEKGKSDADFKSDFSTALIGNFEPQCQGNYETCQHMEPTVVDLEHFKACITASAKKPLIPNAQLSGDRRLDEIPSTSAQARLNQKKENGLNIAKYLQPPKETSSAIHIGNAFRTAREELIIQNAKNKSKNVNNANIFAGATKRSLGGRRTVKSAFVPPFQAAEKAQNNVAIIEEEKAETLPTTDERLLNIDPKMIELIENEIMHKFKPIDWNEIAGLEYAKSIIKEAIVYPLLRPDIFTGLRRPPRGILLFGPPGTGKTLIGKCIASQSNATFFSISASSLTSKWIGESEKMVRALFAVATVKQPSVTL